MKGESMLKKLLIALAALALTAGAAQASAKYGWNPEKGKKLYISKMKKQLCRKLPVKKFTQAHTQKEWKEIIESGRFEEELMKLCPDYKPGIFTEKQLADLGDAVINYAKDSYNIPS
jgi:hypothetical protein